MLLSIILLTIAGSLLSLLGGFILLLRKSWGRGFSLILTSFAAGVLLATAFFDLFPEGVEHLAESGGGDVFFPAFAGIVFFFLLERMFVWFHHHHETHGMKPSVWTVTVGDGLHNFIDGVAIAATYMINPALGLTTTLAVAAHEIPQEIADFSVLLSQGLTRKRAILFNVASACTSLLGAIIMYFFSAQLEIYLGSIIAFTAGMFVYIALSDLIPELHHSGTRKDVLPQILAFALGIAVTLFAKNLVGAAVHGS